MGVGQAFVCALAYWICAIVDGFFGWQACTRPIVLGSVVGLLAGDPKVGCLMGAQLEAVYMGVSAIGGVVSSNYRVATVVGVALVIYSGVDMETGVSLAAAIGAVVNSLSALQKAIRAALSDPMVAILKKGNWKGFVTSMWLQQIFVSDGFNIIVMFITLILGDVVVSTFVSSLPAWVLGGLNAAGNMMVVIGLGLTTQAIWMPNAALYVLLGFILFQYVGLAILPIAVLGTILAVLTFVNDRELKELKEAAARVPAVAVADAEGDDFYG